jgi:thymidine kinase
MNVIDLELYRWQWHNLKYKDEPFIATLPKQSGKTTMLGRITRILENNRQDFVFVVSTEANRNIINRQYGINKDKILVFPPVLASANFVLQTQGVDYKDKHLLIDEYTFYSPHALKELLRMKWKSVVMAGTLKL